MNNLLLVLAFLYFSSLAVFAQSESRIIKMDKPEEGEDRIYFEITSFKVDGYETFFNESFTANENWLKNLKVKVKNISSKPVTCVGIAFGLLEGINEALGPQMSWGDKLGFYYGNCSKNKHDKEQKIIKAGEEIELGYKDIDASDKTYFEKIGIGKFHKAELIYGVVKFKSGDIKDTYWRVPNNVRFFDEDDEN